MAGKWEKEGFEPPLWEGSESKNQLTGIRNRIFEPRKGLRVLSERILFWLRR